MYKYSGHGTGRPCSVIKRAARQVAIIIGDPYRGRLSGLAPRLIAITRSLHARANERASARRGAIRRTCAAARNKRARPRKAGRRLAR
jgi:hypothetical protein